MSTLQALVVGWRAARQATARPRGARAEQARSIAATVGGHALTIAGLGCFTAAAAIVAIPLGLVVAGAAFFILELRASSS